MGIPFRQEPARKKAKYTNTRAHPKSEDGFSSLFGSSTAPATSSTAEPSSTDDVVGGPRNKPVVGDKVALLIDIPWQNIWRGQVGTVTDKRGSDRLEVEFIDETSGDSFQLLAIPFQELMLLQFNQHPDW